MGDITPGYLFVPSESMGRLSSTKLNATGNGAKINPSFVSGKPAVSSVTSSDQLLLLKADGTYARVPATAVGGAGGGGGGDMYKSTYDANLNNLVDHAELADAAPWTGISGKPASFTPSAHASTHLSAGSDPISLATATLAGLCPAVDNTTIQVVSAKLSCVALSYSNLTGVPASFAPSAHASTHLDNGTDPVPVATTARTGSLRALSGSATQYLDGSGAWSTPAGTGPTVDPGVWTALTPASGWSAGAITPQYRVETLGSLKSVYCRGTIQGAWAAIGTTAFTFPSTAFPSAIRSQILSGYQNTGTASDVASYVATVSTAGVVTIYFLAASNFVWADKSQTQVIYLDGLIFSI